MIALLCTKASLFDPVLHVAHPVPMSAFAGLMVPRRAHAAELSHDERPLAWALLIKAVTSHFARCSGLAVETFTDPFD